MARDYAKGKQKKAKSSSSSAQQSNYPMLLPGWIWFLVGLLLGLFVAILGYLKLGSELKREERPASVEQQTTAKKTQPAQESTKPKFDFYTLLSESEEEEKRLVKPEEQPESKAKQPAAKPQEPTVSSVEKEEASTAGQYYVQVGSFRKPGDADGLKAQLTLMGFEASTKQVSLDGETWNRVLVGPYRHKDVALEAQERLADADFSSLIVRSRST